MKTLPDSRVEELSLPLPREAQAYGIKAVIADDDDVMREVVCAPLRKWGIHVVTARDGNEAVPFFSRKLDPSWPSSTG